MKNQNGVAKKSVNGQQIDAKTLLAILAQGISGEQDGIVRKALVKQSKDLVITIPEEMNKLQAAEELERQWNEEETHIDVARQFDGWKWQDVLVAISITAEQHFGWINAQQSFMNPPTDIQVVVDYKDGLPVKRTCFMGEFAVKALENGECSIGVRRGIAQVSFNIKKKYKGHVEAWFDLIDSHLRRDSIYRGKSVVVTSTGGQFDDEVNFEITETKANPKIVLNPKERSIVEQYCALDFKEKGKRAYLFLGGYGNGKTEAAMILGDKAKALGMTFFYVKDSKAFVKMLAVAAKNYSPAFIFMEDIDEIGSGEKRDAEINLLLNTLDGAETKNKDIKVLFTTNHPDVINPALRRPGRLDLIVRFSNPEPETRTKIYQGYLSNVKGAENLDFELCSKETPDCSGAFVAEICKRAIRLAELNGEINNDIVFAAINTIVDHLAMMTESLPKKDVDILGMVATSIANKLAGGVTVNNATDLNPVMSHIGAVHEDLKRQLAGGFKKTYDKAETIKEDTVEIKNATV